MFIITVSKDAEWLAWGIKWWQLRFDVFIFKHTMWMKAFPQCLLKGYREPPSLVPWKPSVLVSDSS